MRASINFIRNIFFQLNHQSLPLVATCLLLIFIAFGCKKDNNNTVAVIPETSEFILLAKKFVDASSLPVILDDITIENSNGIQNLEKTAREVVDEMVFIKTDSTGLVVYNKVKDGVELTDAAKDDAARGLIDDGLIALGDYIVKAEWTGVNGELFYTLGVMGPKGNPKFEPILHYNGISEVEIPNPMHRGWGWGPFTRNVKNGFGSTCVEVEFNVHIATDPGNCLIVDPGPHIEITKAISNCAGWEQQTTKGELQWCNPKPDCECRYENNFPAEECIKFIVVTYVATGFSDIEIEAGVSGNYKGFTVDAKIKMNASRFGAEATYETIKSICASGSTP